MTVIFLATPLSLSRGCILRISRPLNLLNAEALAVALVLESNLEVMAGVVGIASPTLPTEESFQGQAEVATLALPARDGGEGTDVETEALVLVLDGDVVGACRGGGTDGKTVPSGWPKTQGLVGSPVDSTV